MLPIMIAVLGGLGMFFVGINILSENIKQLGNTQAPKIIKAFAKNDVSAALGGLFAGVVTSSGKAVTFTLVALAELGSLNLRQSLPIIMGGSIGSAFIVLWASFDFQTVVFILLACAGFYYQFVDLKKNPRNKAIAGILLGFGLLFLGLEAMKTGAEPMKTLPWFEAYIHGTQGHWFMALIIGTVLALLTQSGSSVAIIAISLVTAGMLGVDEAIMLVFGTNVGSGISTAMLGLGMKGLARKLVYFHGLFKCVGILVMVPLILIEVYWNVPLLKAFVASLTPHIDTQISILYLLYEIVTGIAVAGFLGVIAKNLDRLTPSGEVSAEELPTVAASASARASSAVKAFIPPTGIRIAVAHPDNDASPEIMRTLENNGVKVVAFGPISGDWRKAIAEKKFDVLLVNVGEDADEEVAQLEPLFERSRIPIFFNDQSSMRGRSAGELDLFGSKLAQKLVALVRPLGSEREKRLATR